MLGILEGQRELKLRLICVWKDWQQKVQNMRTERKI